MMTTGKGNLTTRNHWFCSFPVSSNPLSNKR